MSHPPNPSAEPDPAERQRKPLVIGTTAVPTWIEIAIVAAVGVALLWAYSSPGVDLLVVMFAMPVLVVFGFVWVVRLIALIAVAIRHDPLPSARWRLLIEPAVMSVVVLLITINAPSAATFTVNHRALDRAADRALQDGDRYEQPERVGTFEVHDVWTAGDAVFIKTGGGFSDCGFARLPYGPQPEFENGSFERPSYHRLSGSWYHWCASW